ncbi:uncharacterized protein LOC143879538 isoform X2 [Tasmannia lanceolata]|uniref:uncharacterized protein LOC143879538 isoform X2 n=1 Tax=Tasmannia lanceolata TaxID=3420 RepID=UPI0040643A2D
MVPVLVVDTTWIFQQVEGCLLCVEQSPPKLTLNALQPSMNALVAKELLKHSDVDVKVAVASCISEITRITAPDAPYDDESMKEIFRLIVMAFEDLSDMSSRSYSKRVSILETLANVRSCVVMLDLECDALILEMFHHFLRAIRESHPGNVVSSMETIMTLVLEESEEISSELLSCLLGSVKKENQVLLPVARRLGEKVIKNCAEKLKPYLMQEVQSMGNSLDDYSEIVAFVCQETSDALEHSDLNASRQHLADETKLSERTGSYEAPPEAKKMVPEATCPQEAKKMVPEATCPQDADPVLMKPPTPVVTLCNGTAQTENDDSLVDTNSPKNEPERSRRSNHSKESPTTVKPETMPDQVSMRRGRKANSYSSAQSVENSDLTLGSEKEGIEPTKIKNVHTNKEAGNSLSECPSTKDTNVPLENEKKVEISSSTGSHNEINIAPQSPTRSLPDATRLKRARLGPKKKAGVNAEADRPSSSSEIQESLLSGQIGDATQLMDLKSKKESDGKNVHSGNANEDTAMPSVDVGSKKEVEGISDSEAKPLRRSGKRVLDALEGGSSSKRQGSKLKQQKGETQEMSQKKMVSSSKASTKSSITDDSHLEETPKTKTKKKSAPATVASTKSSIHDESHLEETPKTKTKKKRAPVMEEASTKSSIHYESHLEESPKKKTTKKCAPVMEETSEALIRVKDLDGSLVGSKIKVWWPDDEKFYEGVVDSFDKSNGKHTIHYLDDEEEVLMLKDEKWEFLKSFTAKAEVPSGPNSSEMPQKRKRNRNLDSSTKQAKTSTPLKRGTATLASKSISGSTKTGAKVKDGATKSDCKLKSDTAKLGSESKDGIPNSGNKSKEDALKISPKSKDDTSSKSKNDTPKGAVKSKVDSPKTAGKHKDSKACSKSKVDTPKTGKSNLIVNSAKGKEGSSKGKKTIEDLAKGKSSPAKAMESEVQSGKGKKTIGDPAKGKSSSAKAMESEVQSGKGNKAIGDPAKGKSRSAKAMESEVQSGKGKKAIEDPAKGKSSSAKAQESEVQNGKGKKAIEDLSEGKSSSGKARESEVQIGKKRRRQSGK